MNQSIHATEIPIGTPIIYYNHWTRFETDVISGQFKRLTIAEIQKLHEGDVVYVDIDPLHPQGKVYGYVKVLVTGVEQTLNSEYRVHFAGRWTGYKTTCNGVCHTMFKALDEKKLAQIISEHPKCKIIDPRDK